MLYDAYQKDYPQRELVEKTVTAYRYNRLIEYYIESRIIDTLISEQDIIRRYRALSPEYRAYHPYKKVRGDLYKDELARRKIAIDEAVASFYRTIKAETMFHIIEPSFSRFVQKYNDLYRQKAESGAVTPLDLLGELTFDSSLAQIKNRTFDRQWLIETIQFRQINLPAGVLSPATFGDIVETLVTEELIFILAKKENLNREQAYLRSVKKYTDDFILHLYQIDNISNRISDSDDSLFAYYEKYKHVRYYRPPAMEVAVIFLADSQKAAQVLNRARKGENFTSLYQRYNSRSVSRNGYLGFITEEDYGLIGRKALQAQPHQILPELVPVGKFWAVVKTLRYQPAVPEMFEKVKPRVAADYSEENFRLRRMKIGAELITKYRPVVYSERFYNYVKALGEER